MDNVLFIYYMNNVSCLVEKCLGLVESYGSRVDTNQIISWFKCNKVNITITLNIKNNNMYDLSIQACYGIYRKAYIIGNKNLEECLEILDRELNKLNKKLVSYAITNNQHIVY